MTTKFANHESAASSNGEAAVPVSDFEAELLGRIMASSYAEHLEKLAVSINWVKRKAWEGVGSIPTAELPQRIKHLSGLRKTLTEGRKELASVAEGIARKSLVGRGQGKELTSREPYLAAMRAFRDRTSVSKLASAVVLHEFGHQEKGPTKLEHIPPDVLGKLMQAHVHESMGPLMEQYHKDPEGVMQSIKKTASAGSRAQALIDSGANADHLEKLALHPAAIGALGGAAIGGGIGAYTAPEGDRLRRGLVGAGMGGLIGGMAGADYHNAAVTRARNAAGLAASKATALDTEKLMAQNGERLDQLTREFDAFAAENRRVLDEADAVLARFGKRPIKYKNASAGSRAQALIDSGANKAWATSGNNGREVGKTVELNGNSASIGFSNPLGDQSEALKSLGYDAESLAKVAMGRK